MKVALVHDWLTGMRGGEAVLERLCARFPDAPIFTLRWNHGSVSRSIESHAIETSVLQHLPGTARHYRWFLPLFPRAIEGLAIRGFDAVVSSSHCAAKAVVLPPETFHLSYVHTPMRYVWELEREYFPPGRYPAPVAWFIRRTCARLRRWDVATSDRVHALVANSAHVAARIRQHWGRRAEVVHPPVALERFAAGERRGDFYLLAGAFAPYKRADVAIAACRRLGRKLVVVGTGQDERRLLALGGPGIEFRGWVGADELARLYHEARALIFPGEEDFGIVPVEAMASGCPVIALGRGGALETVGRGADAAERARVAEGGFGRAPGGVLYGTDGVAALAAAIEAFEAATFDPREVATRAAPFSTAEFDRGFNTAFERAHATWRAAA